MDRDAWRPQGHVVDTVCVLPKSFGVLARAEGVNLLIVADRC